MPRPYNAFVADHDQVFRDYCDQFSKQEFPGANLRLAKGIALLLGLIADDKNLGFVILNIESIDNPEDVDALASALGPNGWKLIVTYLDDRNAEDATALAAKFGGLALKKGKRFSVMAAAIREHLRTAKPSAEAESAAESD